MNEDLKQMSAMTALNSMMAKSHFDICTIRNVGELLGVDPRRSDAYLILQPLHCIDWAKMPRELRDAVPGLIQQCLGISPAFRFTSARADVIELNPAEKASTGRSWPMRLLDFRSKP